MHATVWALMVSLSGPAGPLTPVTTTSVDPSVTTPGLCAGSVTFKVNGKPAKAIFNAHVRADGVTTGHFKYAEQVPGKKPKAYTLRIDNAQFIENAPGQPGAAWFRGQVIAGDGVGRSLIVHLIDGGSPARTKDFISVRGAVTGAPVITANRLAVNQVFSPVLKGNIVVKTD